VWKWLLSIVVVLAAVCGGGGFLFSLSPQYEAVTARFSGQTETLEVETATVERGLLVRSINAPGVIEPDQTVDVSARVSGEIVELPFDEGDTVRKGDVLVRLDDRQLRAQLESTKAQRASEQAQLSAARAAVSSAESSLVAERARLQGAEATAEQATLALQREQTLFDSGDRTEATLQAAQAEARRADSALAAATSAVEQAQIAIERARAQLEAAERAVDIASANILRVEEDIANTVIRSPIDGTVVRRNAELGEVAIEGTLNRDAARLMQIADLSGMVMRAQVDEANIAFIDQEQPANVYINAYGDRVFQGRVRSARLVNDIDQRTQGIYFETEIELQLQPGERLRSGLRANCDIEVERLPSVLIVPTQAVQDVRVSELPADLQSHPLVDRARTFTRVVYTVENNTLRAKPVRIGPSDLVGTSIEEGLEPGDVVVTGPFDAFTQLEDGKQVDVRDLTPTAEEPQAAGETGNTTGQPAQSPAGTP